jgi:hypothetical protein
VGETAPRSSLLRVQFPFYRDGMLHVKLTHQKIERITLRTVFGIVGIHLRIGFNVDKSAASQALAYRLVLLYNTQPNSLPPSPFTPLLESIDSPLRQTQQQIPLRPLNETPNIKPARRPITIHILRPRAHSNRKSRDLPSCRCRREFGLVCQAADQLHACQSSGSGRREGASEGAGRMEAAEGLHCCCLDTLSRGGCGSGFQRFC